MQPRKVRFINYAAYGSNDFLGAGAMAVISGWILFFYTTFCGLTPVQAAAIFSIARISDAVASPLIGFVSDHFNRTRLGRRFGRRRFFILVAIPLMPSFALMWVNGQSFWYYLVTYLLFELVYTFELIPYETLAAEMSPDFQVKAKFAGARILCGQVAAILAGILPGRIIEWLGKNSASTFLYLGLTFSAVFMVAATAVYFCTWERPIEETLDPAEAGEKLGPFSAIKRLYSDLWSTVRVRAFRLHLGMYLGGYTSQDVFNAVFTYFIVFALGGTVVAASNVLGAMAVTQLVAVAIVIPLVLKTAPAFAYRIAVSLFAAAVVWLLALYAVWGAGAASLVIFPALLAGLGRGALNYIPWNTYNYMADVDQVVTGQRREGAYAGVMTFVRKATQALAVMLVGVILQAGGFVSGAKVQSPQAVHTIVGILGAASLAILATGFLVSLRFKLDRHTHEMLMTVIDRFKRGEAEAIPPEQRRIVENLSGWSFDRLWGRNPLVRHPPRGLAHAAETGASGIAGTGAAGPTL